MTNCPHCKRPGIKAWEKSHTSPQGPATCTLCGKQSYTPKGYWLAGVITIVLIAAYRFLFFPVGIEWILVQGVRLSFFMLITVALLVYRVVLFAVQWSKPMIPIEGIVDQTAIEKESERWRTMW